MGFINRIKKRLKLNAMEISEKQESKQNDETEAPQAILNQLLEGKFEKFVSTGQEFRFRELLMKVGNAYWNRGKEDGKLGQNKVNLSKIAVVDAEFIKDDIRSSYKAKVDQLQSRIKIKQQIYNHAEKDYNDSNLFYERAFKEFGRNSRYFSRSLAILYLLVALLLIFADIPLALELTQQGFDLDLGQNFQIKQLFESPVHVFQENWEVFILAFGVALCSIFIKIFYDEFIERPLEKILIQFRDLSETTSEEEKDLIQRKQKKRNLVKKGILSLTFITIICLGVFRYQTIEHENRQEELAMKDQLLYNSYNRSQESSANADSGKIGKDKFERIITGLSFILITLLFPTIGGVCFSIGSNYWGNRNDLNKSKELAETSKNAFLIASKELEELTIEYSNWEGALEWCNSPDFVNHIEQLFLNYYDHGYQRGMIEPDPKIAEKDLYTQAVEFRNSMILKGIYATLQNEYLSNYFTRNDGISRHARSNIDSLNHESIHVKEEPTKKEKTSNLSDGEKLK